MSEAELKRAVVLQRVVAGGLTVQEARLAKTDYAGCNFTFLSELLAEHQDISISPTSVGRVLKANGLTSSRKHGPPRLHRRRQRKPQFGMLVLVDGSHHDWLEGRGPRLCLFVAIDDATGRLVAAILYNSSREHVNSRDFSKEGSTCTCVVWVDPSLRDRVCIP